MDQNDELLAFKQNWEDVRSKIKYTLTESIPKAEQERKKYMSDIAAFYAIVFKKKLESMIGSQYQALALLGKTDREYDQFRMNINCFLIEEWFEDCTNEHLGDLEEMRKAAGNNDDFISNMKETYATEI